MAASTTEVSRTKVYALIGNIPPHYHSADLRKFFLHFIEDEGFDCFHFKHRPEGQNDTKLGENENVTQTSSSGNSSRESKPSEKTKPMNKTCCIVRMNDDEYRDLRQLYHKKHWTDKKGDIIPSLCFVSRINLAETTAKDDPPSNQDTEDAAAKPQSPSVRGLSREDLEKLMELKPPVVMPNGNVGTPSKVFLDLIRECRLPPKVIGKLGLTFPKSNSRRIYSNVKFDYRDGSACSGKRPVLSSLGKKSSKSGFGLHTDKDNRNKSNVKNRTFNGGDGHEKAKEMSESEEDGDDGEEWERHESLHDDPANYERNKERVYEENLEVVWEKGGPGLVWYTDETYWREQEGDFDEQTADDWDVDMSVYYEPLTGGDFDSRQLVTMRREARRRRGEESGDELFSGIGKFEKHTKGVGRRVLEQQGWKEGAGLGPTTSGIPEALEGDGQTGRDKTGFGYHGEKLQRFGSRAGRKRQTADEFMISTVYDKPEDMELPEKLLRRTDHNRMKYREKIKK